MTAIGGVNKGAANGFEEQIERMAPGERPDPFNPIQKSVDSNR